MTYIEGLVPHLEVFVSRRRGGHFCLVFIAGLQLVLSGGGLVVMIRAVLAEGEGMRCSRTG